MSETQKPPFAVGDLITNGSSAGKVLREETRHGVPGLRVENIPLGEFGFGGNRGRSQHIPDHVLRGWRLVSFEWSRLPGGDLEAKYEWAGLAAGGHLVRRVRVAAP